MSCTLFIARGREQLRKKNANSTFVENRGIWRKFGEICLDQSGETNFAARLEQPIQVRRLLLPTHTCRPKCPEEAPHKIGCMILFARASCHTLRVGCKVHLLLVDNCAQDAIQQQCPRPFSCTCRRCSLRLSFMGFQPYRTCLMVGLAYFTISPWHAFGPRIRCYLSCSSFVC